MKTPNRLPIVAVALTALSAGCTPADDATSGEAEATEVGLAVAEHGDVVSTFSSTIEAALGDGSSNAVGDGIRARIDAALELLVVNADCLSASWVLNTATIRFDACELAENGALLDGAVSVRVRVLVPSVVVTMDSLTLGDDSVAGSITAYPIGPLAELTFGIDADLTFAGAERTLAVDGLGVASGIEGVTLSGDGAVISPEVVADATLDDVHLEIGDCLPSSGSVEFQTENVHGFLRFLPTTPETGEVSLRIPPLPAANIPMFPPCE